MESKEECTPHNKCNDCELCTAGGDEDKILVSVSPRRFGLPHSNEKKTKIEIRNKNSYPIYFKAETSNTSAFRPQPSTGRIAPHGKVSGLYLLLFATEAEK